MSDTKILNTILRWCKMADDRKDCDALAQERFKEIIEFAEKKRRERSDAGGGWL